MQPFAAPRTEGIWDGVRAEIRSGITKQGGTADEVEGPLGTELRTKVPVRAADGSQAVQPARFIGVDGPRWFLRGVITGRPALEPDTDADLVSLFRDDRRGPRWRGDGAAGPDPAAPAGRRRPGGGARRRRGRDLRRPQAVRARSGDHRDPLTSLAAVRGGRRRPTLEAWATTPECCGEP